MTWPRLISVLVLLLLPTAGLAQGTKLYKLTDWEHRLQVGVHGGALWIPGEGPSAEWKGGEVGGAVNYNLQEIFTVYGDYSHGFPLHHVDGQRNTLRVACNVKVHPGPSGEPITGAHLYVGGGAVWTGASTVKDWQGYEAHAKLVWLVNKKWAGFLGLSHGFARDPAAPDLDFIQAGVIARAYP